MENQKPFELKNVMVAFNVIQILVNLYLGTVVSWCIILLDNVEIT